MRGRLRHTAGAALRGERGLTLIEIVVAVAVMAVIITVIAVSVGAIRRAELNQTASKLGAAMRTLYNMAIVNNRPYRLVIDLEKGEFWGESLADNDPCNWYLKSAADEAERKSKTRIVKTAFEDDEEMDTAVRARFSKTKQSLLKPQMFPKGIRVTAVITDNLDQPQTEGLAAIHFFPGGRAERAYIWLGEVSSDEDGETEPEYTVAISGLMGRVTKHTEALDESQFFDEGSR